MMTMAVMYTVCRKRYRYFVLVVYRPGDESLPVVVRQSAIVFVRVVSGGGHRPSILMRVVVSPRRPAISDRRQFLLYHCKFYYYH